jgi:hypothetical protein
MRTARWEQTSGLRSEESVARPARAPAWLWIATAVLAAGRLAAFLAGPLTALRAAALAVSLLVAWFLFRGVRFAWALALLSALLWLASPLLAGGPSWKAGAGALLLASLFAPSSRAYVWSERPLSPSATASAGLASRVFVTTETIKEKALDDRVFGPLAAIAVVLFVVNELLYRAHYGFAEGILIIDVLWHVVRATSGLALLVLLAVLGARGYRYARGRLG